MKSVVGRSRHGPSSPNGLTAATTRPGCASCNATGAKRASSAIDVPLDQTTMSAFAISSRVSSTSRATVADATTLSFDVDRNRKNAPSSPGAIDAPLSDSRRNRSPVASSTLTTSAPPSTSNLVQYAPASPLERSITCVPTIGHASLTSGTVGPATTTLVPRQVASPPRWGLPPFAAGSGVVGSGRARSDAEVTAAGMWARAELRARWKAWVLLGLLAGVTVGIAAAGIAGARRTDNAVPNLVTASRIPTAAVLLNDPRFDDAQLAKMAALPPVRAVYPFLVGVSTSVLRPSGVDGSLIPTTPATTRVLAGALVDGRLPDPRRADEVVVDENMRNRHGLDLGSTMLVGATASELAHLPPSLAPPAGYLPYRQRLTVVGIAKSASSDETWTPSSAFYEKYGRHLARLENFFVDLHGGESAIPRFAAALSRPASSPRC